MIRVRASVYPVIPIGANGLAGQDYTQGFAVAEQPTRPSLLVVSELKTPKSRRTLTLTPELVARFRQNRLRQAEAQMAAGTLWQDHGLIFASEADTPMDPDNFSHSFARLCERARLGHWHPHELRHSGASPFAPGHAAGCGLRRARARQYRHH